MSTTANTKYPFFDLSEIISDTDIAIKTFKTLRPVKAGNQVPDFSLTSTYSRWQNFYNGAPTFGPVLLKQLLSRPLVVGFYSHHWKENGLDLLKQFNAAQFEIKANGGNVLIVTAEQSNDELAKLAWEHGLSLNFYYDNNYELAKAFRVFSEEDPTWNRFSGVDENVPLLATYVIDTTRQIVYDHVDRDLSETFSTNEVIAAVYEAALIQNSRRSA